MQVPVTWRWNGRIAGWIISALAAFFFLPGTVRATCGEYHPKVRPGQGIVFQLGDQPVDQPLHSQEKKPCSGPYCSGSPSLPSLPTQTSPRFTNLEIIWILNGLELIAPDSSWQIASEELLQSLRTSSDVFHPPRFSV